MASSASDADIPKVRLAPDVLAAYEKLVQDFVPPVADLESLLIESFQQYQGSPFKGAVDALDWQACVFERLDECLDVSQKYERNKLGSKSFPKDNVLGDILEKCVVYMHEPRSGIQGTGTRASLSDPRAYTRTVVPVHDPIHGDYNEVRYTYSGSAADGSADHMDVDTQPPQSGTTPANPQIQVNPASSAGPSGTNQPEQQLTPAQKAAQAKQTIRQALIAAQYSPELLNQRLQDLDDVSDARAAAVSTLKSTTKSHPPATFHGHIDDHGQKAQSWLYSVRLYYAAEHEQNPVAKVATYLRDHALTWWQQFGSKSLPPDAVFQQFADVFLARFVKPSDSAAARKELPTLKQGDLSVEHFAALFRSTNNRVTVGSPIDTTTLAGWFVGGLKSSVSKAIVGHEPLSTMQDLDLVISAAEDMEAKLSLAAKQVHPSVNALQHDTTGDKPKRGGHSRRGRGGRGGGPNRNRDTLNAVQSAGVNKGAYQPGRGSANATRGSQTGKHVAQNNAAAGGTDRRSFDPSMYCLHCQRPGHWTDHCRKLQAANAAAAEQAKKRNGPQVSFSTDAYDHAMAVYTADREFTFPSDAANSVLHASTSHDADTALHMQTDCLIDTSALLTGIGSPHLYGDMPDPSPIAGWAPNHLGHFNALSPNGLTMIFHGLIAVGPTCRVPKCSVALTCSRPTIKSG